MSSFNPITTLWGWYYKYSHFSGEKAEAQRHQGICPRSHSNQSRGTLICTQDLRPKCTLPATEGHFPGMQWPKGHQRRDTNRAFVLVSSSVSSVFPLSDCTMSSRGTYGAQTSNYLKRLILGFRRNGGWCLRNLCFSRAQGFPEILPRLLHRVRGHHLHPVGRQSWLHVEGWPGTHRMSLRQPLPFLETLLPHLEARMEIMRKSQGDSGSSRMLGGVPGMQ